MWTRTELKSRGKTAFKANYWRCVLVALILFIVGGGIGAVSGSFSSRNAMNLQDTQPSVTAEQSIGDLTGEEEIDTVLNSLNELDDSAKIILIPIILGIVLVAVAFGLLIAALLLNPLTVGCQRFFSENSKEPAALGEVAYGFEHGYGRVVKTMFLRDIFILLWTLLLIIPGIIKSYSYRMVPYILAQEPEMGAREAIDRSREMMNGHKWRAFVLDLSFILWIFLSIITLGIVGIFYVYPYIEATNAELYYAIRGEIPGYQGDSAYSNYRNYDGYSGYSNYSDTDAPL